MGDYSCLEPRVDCYTVRLIRIGSYATVSQYSFLCAASHDIDSPDMKLITAPIVLADHVWVAADAFVAPGVTVQEGAVVGARASVFKDVAPWTVVGGNPARALRLRSRAHLEKSVSTQRSPLGRRCSFRHHEPQISEAALDRNQSAGPTPYGPAAHADQR
jgi:acetyltransferase-like isoleucine patch superfamily enzyme